MKSCEGVRPLFGLARQMTPLLWRPPGPPLRSSVFRAVIAGVVVILVYAPIVAAETMSGADYIKRSLVFFVAAALLAVGRVAAHHPFPHFGAANFVTMLRVALVAGVAGLIGEPPSERIAWLAVAVVVTVAVLDGVDGWLARRSGEISAFGARFDMEVDAALILILSILVWLHGKAGMWVMACGLMRYGFVAAGWVLPWMAGPLRSTMRGKSVAVAQFTGLGAALLPVVPVPFSTLIAGGTLATLVWSFAVDIAWLKQQAGGGRRRV
jgi:phosphatidylglycerophosphate synthase